MGEVTCRGLPASWLNAWLAAVGATVLDSRLRLRWTTENTPTAVLSAKEIDPVAALADSWPDKDELADMPIAEQWDGTPPLPRKVSVEAFAARAQATRGHSYSWTLSSTMTDLDVDNNGEVAHAPFDPAGPGTIKWLHHRLLKVHRQVVAPSTERILESLTGRAARVKDNGLGFDISRMGSQADASGMAVDPVIEVLAFFGLALLPVRGEGKDRSTGNISYSTAIQRGWRRIPGRSSGERVFMWPAWMDALDHAGVDALLDVWKPDKRFWPRIGVHAAWQSVRFQPRASADATRAFGAELL